jgi:hypothetical protein
LYECETYSLTLKEERTLRVFESRVLRRIFGPKRKELTVEWRRIYEELNDLHTSPNIILVMKSRILWRAVHIARMGRRQVHREFWWGNLRERDHLEEHGVDGRIMLRSIFRKWDRRMDWIDLAQARDRWRHL